jgi:hypothetical protein
VHLGGQCLTLARPGPVGKRGPFPGQGRHSVPPGPLQPDGQAHAGAAEERHRRAESRAPRGTAARTDHHDVADRQQARHPQLPGCTGPPDDPDGSPGQGQRHPWHCLLGQQPLPRRIGDMKRCRDDHHRGQPQMRIPVQAAHQYRGQQLGQHAECQRQYRA